MKQTPAPTPWCRLGTAGSVRGGGICVCRLALKVGQSRSCKGRGVAGRNERAVTYARLGTGGTASGSSLRCRRFSRREKPVFSPILNEWEDKKAASNILLPRLICVNCLLLDSVCFVASPVREHTLIVSIQRVGCAFRDSSVQRGVGGGYLIVCLCVCMVRTALRLRGWVDTVL